MKKAIDWFALAIGLALALFGARWMWTGWDIVQAERGWAALISGSVMLSGGLIVAMLAWMTMRLAGAPMPARDTHPAEDGAPAKPLAPTPLASTPLSPAPAAALGAGVVAAATAVGVALARDGSQENDAEQDSREPVKEEASDLSTAPRPAPPSVSELLRRSEERAPREAFDLDALEDEPGPVRPPVAPPLPPVAPPPLPPLPADEAEKEISPEPAAADEKPEPPPAPVVAAPDLSETSATSETPIETKPIEPKPVESDEAKTESEPEPPRLSDAVPPPSPAPVDEPVYDDWLERTAREFDRELGRDKLPKDEAEPPEPPASTPAQAPRSAIVGRYSSGDTNYLMFADGSIEAQTPDGVMRFASLTELKRFVEKRN